MTDDTGERWDEDPGWPLGWRVLILIVPGMLQHQIRQARGDGLLMLRNVFASFVLAIVMFGVVLIFIPVPLQVSPWPWLFAVLVIAAVSITASKVFERPLDCTSDASLAGSYRTRFFLRIAFAEAIALFAFVFYFLTGPLWIYYVGAAIALARMLPQAPTSAALVRDQDDLTARGCSRSLVSALRHPRPS